MDRRLALAALAAAAASPALAQQPAPAARVLSGDYRTLTAIGGTFALETSRLAAQRAVSPAVRQFALFEIREQEAVAQALQALGPLPPPALSADKAALLQQLQATPRGPAFDRAYVRGQIIGHEELRAIQAGHLQSGAGGPSFVLARLSLASIEQHLTMLRQMGRA